MAKPGTTTSRIGISQQSRNSFTLVEVILVAVVLVLLMVAAVPRFQETAQRLRAEQTAFELAQMLRYAHERAVTGGDAVTWVWDEEAGRASLELAAGDGESGLPEASVMRSAPLAAGLSVRVMRDDQPVDHLRFFPDGTSEPAAVSVLRRDRVYTVSVDGATSQVLLSTGPAAR
jgi:Tfp pilus assembly protein FimT